MGIAIDGGLFSDMNSQEVAEKRKIRTAVWVSNLANVVLCAAKGYVSLRSGSVALIASTVDNLLNVVSGFILWSTAISLQKLDPRTYPARKERIRPVGVVSVASVMATIGLQSLIGSCGALVAPEYSFFLQGNRMKWVVGIVVFVTFVKSLLANYCKAFRNELLKAYAQDHVYDIIINIIGLGAAIIGHRSAWWVDHTGAILLSLYTMRLWCVKVLENVNSLVEQTAPPDYLQKLTHLCSNHHEDVRHVDTSCTSSCIEDSFSLSPDELETILKSNSRSFTL
uniref:Cation efflux protein transmembrane domain-containing protein n=1 Tax=Araucaria cunninghamii TaxID=56994 RepID=A0A0D6QWK0_ARACU